MTVNGQHYCLRWNNYQSNMTSVFHQLLRNESFVDVTLACNESTLKAHKVNYKYFFLIILFYYCFTFVGSFISMFFLLPKTIDGQPMQTSNHYTTL